MAVQGSPFSSGTVLDGPSSVTGVRSAQATAGGDWLPRAAADCKVDPAF